MSERNDETPRTGKAEATPTSKSQPLTGSFNLVAGIEPAPGDHSELTSRRAE